MNPDQRSRAHRLLAALALASVLALAPAFLAAPAFSEPSGVVNVNTASAAELERLPGVGAARAKAILELREQRGGFETVEELVDVKGIGETSLERLRPLVTLSGPTTLSE